MSGGSSDRFELLAAQVCARWDQRDTEAPSLDEIVADWARYSPELTASELAELCLLDQALRSRCAAIARVEEYLARLPKLAADASQTIDLAYGELRIRRDRGEQVTEDELRCRFPVCFELLRDQLEFGDWWNRQVVGVGAGESLVSPPPPAKILPGTRFGSYELLEVIGHGGMGIVYRARRAPFDCDVALKVIRPERMNSAADRQRFRNEITVVAKLDHPGIVPIFDFGEVAGVPYFTMRLMTGGDLHQACRRQAMDCRRAAKIAGGIARALHHSHERGVLHRDVKLTNILLDDANAPQLSDFGLAAKLDSSSRSLTDGEILGTPIYLPPEQLSATTRPPTIAGDIYGLGAVLYELLTGTPPFENPLVIPLLESIRRGEPELPSRRAPHLPLDLERICLKAMARCPADRYPTAADFADDLQRYLDGKPTRARPLSWWQRRLRWAAQHPDVALLAAAMLAIATTLLSLLGVQAVRLRGARRAADQAFITAHEKERLASVTAYVSAIRASHIALQDGDPIEFSRLLDECRPSLNGHDERGFEWFLLDRHCRPHVERWPLPGHESRCVKFSPNGHALAVAGEGPSIRLLDPRGGHPIRIWPSYSTVRDVSFSPNGTALATVSDDGRLRLYGVDDPGRNVVHWPLSDQPLRNVVFLGVENRVATCDTAGIVRVVDTDTGKSVATFRDAEESIECVAASPDGAWIATGGEDGSIVIRDVASRETLYRFSIDERKQIKCLAVSPDGQRIAVGGVDRFLRVADLRRPWSHNWIYLGRHLERLYSIAFSPDGLRVGGCDKSGAALIARLSPANGSDRPEVGPRETSWMAHSGRAYSLAFDPHSERIVTVGMGDHLAFWSLPATTEAKLFGDTGTRTRFDHSLAFAPDGNWLAVASRTGVEIWDPRECRLLDRLSVSGLAIHHVAVSPDGRWLAAANTDERHLEVWRRQGSGFQAIWRDNSLSAAQLSFSATNDTLAVADWKSDRVAMFRVANGARERVIPARQCNGAAFSPKGRGLAYTELDEALVENEGSKWPWRLRNHWNTVRGVSWSPSGQWLATFSEDRRIVIWDSPTRQRHCELIGHRSQAISGQFVNDDRLLSLEEDGSLLVWHVRLARLLCRLKPIQAGRFFDIAVSPDGQTAACHLEDGRVQLLDLRLEERPVLDNQLNASAPPLAATRR